MKTATCGIVAMIGTLCAFVAVPTNAQTDYRNRVLNDTRREVDSSPTADPLALLKLAGLGHEDPYKKWLTSQLDSPDSTQRREAALRLGLFTSRHPDTSKKLVSLVSDPDPGVREAATLALRQVDDVTATFLQVVLESGTSDARLQAIRVFWEVEPRFLPKDVMIRALSDPVPAVRREAAAILSRWHEQDLSSILLLLRNSDPEVVQLGVDHLRTREYVPPDYRAELFRIALSMFESGDSKDKVTALQQMEKTGPFGQQHVDFYRSIMGGIAEEVVDAAVHSIERLMLSTDQDNWSVVYPVVERMADSSSVTARVFAAQFLRAYLSNNHNSLTSLVTLLADPDVRVRLSAISSMTQYDSEVSPHARALVQQLKVETDERVSGRILECLVKVGRHPDVDVDHIKRLARTGGALGPIAIRVLGSVAPTDPEVLPLLLPQEQDTVYLLMAKAFALGRRPFLTDEGAVGLVTLSRNASAQVREKTVASLGSAALNHDSILNVVRTATNDDDGQVRRSAVRALVRPGSKAHLFLLDVARSSPHPDTRSTAIRELSRTWYDLPPENQTN